MELHLGPNIRALRLQKGVSQEALAGQLGVTFQAVSKWETGVTAPDIALLPELAVYFGVPIDDLFALSEAARLDRVQTLLDDVRTLTREQFDASRTYLSGVIAKTPDNARANALLAELYLKAAQNLREMATASAQRALAIAPDTKAHHVALIEAMGGVVGDYYFQRHYALNAYYKQFLEEHPADARAHLFAFDQLFADARYEEAEQVLEAHKRLSPRHVCHLFYAGDLLYARGQREAALALWQQGETDYDGARWLGHCCYAERMERLCRYEEALAHYRLASDAAEKPRFVDPQLAMAQIYELLGRYEEAIAVREEEIAIKKEEWGFESGEAIDAPLRAIAALRRK
ncbi:MAG: helix-turn-helix domain-containing protein [Oscillospiraceae bacterium]|jgi:transcriptional regulator with XRE-family HTH domain|nr:helix-turn-helix domain-containing protein [Oscillospiraceae bacterium]